MKKAVIEVKHAGVTYVERKRIFQKETYQAIKDLNFDIYESETLGIIGRNGAGKSTLLRLLAGIIKPDIGEILFHTKSVSLMALQAGFDMNLSGRHNAIISGMLLGHTKKQIIELLEDIKAFSELGDFFEKPIKTYSSGMNARLGFSIAMFATPSVLLIDEVLGVGDAKFKKKAETAIEEKINSHITVVLVSHSEAQINKLAHRVVWIDNGIVRRQGKPIEVYPEYNLEVFLSSKNIRLKEFVQDESFICIFEQPKVDEEFLILDCILVAKDDRKISSIQTRKLDGLILTESICEESNHYKSKLPDFVHSSSAKFRNCKISRDGKTELFAYIDNQWIKFLDMVIN